MAAYGGLVSLINLMEPMKLYFARHDISVDKLLETFQEKVISLQKFLETYSNSGRTEGEDLENEIVVAVLAAEDQIESHIVDDILARSTSNKETDFQDQFSQVLEEVIEQMDIILKKSVTIGENSMPNDKQSPVLTSVVSHVTTRMSKDSMMVLDNKLVDQIMEKLMTTGRQTKLELIPITGMGGIGKTTLARHVYDHPQIKKHFDIFGWITISQEINLQKTMSGLLHEMGVKGNLDEDTPIHELGNMLHKHLQGRRYLIVTDDIWSLEAWDAFKIGLPDDGKGSRVMITTRDLKLGEDICSSNTCKMDLLDDKQSWSLLQKKVFGEESCPTELENIGKRIAGSCKGLPLSISVIGGVLAKSRDPKYWENIANDISARVTSEGFPILRTSYRYLPIHLKPCFLYLGTFPEDHKISVSELKRLWVAEGFLKPSDRNILEDVAYINIKDLIGRNLIYVDEEMLDHAGNVQYCKIHDLLRELCLTEAQKQQFLYATRVHKNDISQGFSNHRRFALHGNKSKDVDYSHINDELLSSSFIRSFICTFPFKPKPSFVVKLLRIWSLEESYHDEVLSGLLNARYLDFGLVRKSPKFPSSISLLWNLQTIKSGYRANTILPCEMWEMSQLRHVNIMMFRVDAPRGAKKDSKDFIELKYLQTLSRVVDFKCSEDVLAKIPHVRQLKVSYVDKTLLPEYLENLGRLEELESLACHFVHEFPKAVTSKLEFPQSIKKITLELDDFSWEEMGKKIGSLPNLQKLKLYYCWKCSTQEGEVWMLDNLQFRKLVYLKIVTRKLKQWEVVSNPLPCLENLVLEQMDELEEVPSDIGYIPNLKSITLRGCSEDAIKSVKDIQDEQKDMGNENIVVTIE